MKRRAAEAFAVLAVLIVLFAAVNLLTNGIADATAKIDGEYYNIGERDLSLTLMTEEGLDQLSRFTRLNSLKIIPYKAAVINAMSGEDPNYNAAVRRETENTYHDCTDVEDISFVSVLPDLERLDVSYCSVSDISCLVNMQKLTALNISYTEVSDLSPLAELDNITELVITGIPAEDLSPLLEMDGLSEVKMSGGADDNLIAALEKKGVNILIFNENE